MEVVLWHWRAIQEVFQGQDVLFIFFVLLFYCTLSGYYLLVLYEVQIQKISRFKNNVQPSSSWPNKLDQTNIYFCQNVTIFYSRSNMGHALQDIGPSSLLLIPARTDFLSSFLLTQPDIWQKCGSLLKQLLISKVLLNMRSPFSLSLTIYL